MNILLSNGVELEEQGPYFTATTLRTCSWPQQSTNETAEMHSGAISENTAEIMWGKEWGHNHYLLWKYKGNVDHVIMLFSDSI